MATRNWSDFLNGADVSLDLYDPVANPDGDVFHFDDVDLSAYDLYMVPNDDLDVVTITDFNTYKTVTFNVDIRTVTTGNVTFADGSVILVGDNSYGTANDGAGNTLVGGAGDDQLLGLFGNDSLVGGAGDDVLTDPFGNNTLVGGGGTDWFNIHSAVGSASAATGGAGRDSYYLDAESPSLLVGADHNYLVKDFDPGAGGDIIYASDLFFLTIGYVDQDPFAAGFFRLRQAGANIIFEGDRDGAAGGTYTWTKLLTLQNVQVTSLTVDNFPDLVVGTDANDLLTGTETDVRNDGNDLLPGLFGNDTLEGLSGSDYLTAAAGNDVLDGGVGADFMLGGTGRDLYYVDNVNDQVVEESNGPAAVNDEPEPLDDFTDTVIAVVNYSLDNVDYVENLTLSSTATQGTGNGLNNKLTGNNLHNTLKGLGGSDTLDGGTGRDTMAGGAGNDVYYVNVGGDGVTEVNAGGIDEIRTTVTLTTLAANVENLRLIGNASSNGSGNGLANTITGNSAGNTLSGGGQNDTLIGMGGGDVLRGGAGNDTLTGSAGQDNFEFSSALNANVDRITDFNPASDTLWLDNAVFTAFATAGMALPGAAFYSAPGATAAHDLNDRIIYNSTSGRVYYDADGSGVSSSPIHFATLTAGLALAAADFFII